MMIPFDLKIITISLVVLICLDNFVVLGQQKRNCGTKFNAIKAADFVATSSDELKIYEMPWMVSIVKKIKPDVAACSGTLVASKYIITAAHCFKHLPKEAFEVILGTDNLSQHPYNIQTQTYQKKFNIHKLYKHPSYEGKFYHDVAIIELENGVTFSDGIFPICLPERETPTNNRAGFLVTLAGFGSTGNGLNQKLRFASLQIKTQRYCNREYQKLIGESNLFTSEILCAGSTIQGIGSCHGDSGGPLMKSNDFEEYFEQIAVTKGGDAQTACGSFPGIYTRLDDPGVFQWMQKVISGTMVPTTTQIPVNPCVPTPCGPGAICTESNVGNAICRCEPGLIPKPDTITGCGPECTRDPDCSTGFVCLNQRCASCIIC